MGMSDSYQVYALRYATRASTRAEEYFRYSAYGEPDGPHRMDYFFWVIRNDERTILVDCGFNAERAAPRGRLLETPPVELLARLGIAAGDVDHVIVSHMHYDHVGNLDLFPNATVLITRDEYEFWVENYGARQLMKTIADPIDVEAVRGLNRQGRLRIVDSDEEIFPGVRMISVGGHAPGQAIVEVRGRSGEIVLAVDAAYYYECLERDWPTKLYDNLGNVYRAYDLLRQYADLPGHTVVPGHEPLVASRFTHVAEDCIDLSSPR
jgi:glyoxylase-like metal-dependent hydrolase (beta-lactamase superfamily II)